MSSVIRCSLSRIFYGTQHCFADYSKRSASAAILVSSSYSELSWCCLLAALLAHWSSTYRWTHQVTGESWFTKLLFGSRWRSSCGFRLDQFWIMELMIKGVLEAEVGFKMIYRCGKQRAFKSLGTTYLV